MYYWFYQLEKFLVIGVLSKQISVCWFCSSCLKALNKATKWMQRNNYTNSYPKYLRIELYITRNYMLEFSIHGVGISGVEHRSANSKVWGTNPYMDSEYFLCLTLVERIENIFHYFVNKLKNLPPRSQVDVDAKGGSCSAKLCSRFSSWVPNL